MKMKFHQKSRMWGTAATLQRISFEAAHVVHAFGQGDKAATIAKHSKTRMDAFHTVFIHQPEYRVIICKQCRYAVNPA